ncbi:helix-turn-helix transcriptional regulator [Oscillibacter valericigenes]|uniref:helix-turn-helix domain-containing protein n=1 Tax=Oscillibacter ruminantium TaxID=1263547 RepID=UPI00068585EC|nr:helix-turn-helix transcriptional regulator [Oscillibacter ruminantium]MDN0031641.1 helix-turn-helix transcriptional regulator [Oscillibacter valericigenes]
MDIVDRIFELVDEKYQEQREFAAKIGVTASVVSEWRRRKSASYVKRLEIISEELNTTPQYLLYGNESDKKATTSKAGAGAVKPEHIRAAFFEGAEDLSKEEMDMLWDDARSYMQYKLEQRRKQKHDK